MSENGHRAVAREYRRLAPRYDQKWAFYVGATVRETMRRLPPDLGECLLDVACGTGALIEAIAAAHPDVRLAGVDISPEMLAVARRRLPAEVELKTASADALGFRDGSIDTVVTSNAFHFFPSPDRALDEIRRVLRPGGTLVITDWCDDYIACRICDRLLRWFSASHQHVYASAECRVLLEGAGFDVVELHRYKISWLWGLMTVIARKPT